MKRFGFMARLGALPLAAPAIALASKMAPVADSDVATLAPYTGPQMAYVYVHGVAETGEMVSMYAGDFELPMVQGLDDASTAAFVRNLPSLQSFLQKFNTLIFDRLTVSVGGAEKPELIRDFQAPLDPAKLPFGWTSDLTGWFRPYWTHYQ